MNERYYNPELWYLGTPPGRGLGPRARGSGCPYRSSCPYRNQTVQQQGGISRSELRAELTDFFQHNPKPTDNQVHSLAAQLRVDKHKLEEVIYEMLGEAVKKNII